MAGTAWVVLGATVVVFRYQVLASARRANPGKVSASIAPVPSSSDAVGSSSRITRTTGTGAAIPSTGALSTEEPATTAPPGDAKKNSPAKTTWPIGQVAQPLTDGPVAAGEDADAGAGREADGQADHRVSDDGLEDQGQRQPGQDRDRGDFGAGAQPRSDPGADLLDEQPESGRHQCEDQDERHHDDPVDLEDHQGLGALAERGQQRLCEGECGQARQQGQSRPRSPGPVAQACTL